ncbi:unnamed protein product, partial [Callosobruchus maculatus]
QSKRKHVNLHITLTKHNDHSKLSASVSCKIHCCTYYRYKTTIKLNFHKHMVKHLVYFNQPKRKYANHHITLKTCNEKIFQRPHLKSDFYSINKMVAWK